MVLLELSQGDLNYDLVSLLQLWFDLNANNLKPN